MLVSRNSDQIRADTRQFWAQTQVDIEALCGRTLSFDENDFFASDKQKELFARIQTALDEKFRYKSAFEDGLDQHSSEADLQFQHLPQYLLLVDVLQEAFRTEVVHPFGLMRSVQASLDGKQAASEKALLEGAICKFNGVVKALNG